MKKKIWIPVLIALLLLSRVEHTGVDVGELEPVELVQLSKEEAGLCVETDTGARGYGQNLETAIENLYESSSAAVFLDTAEYLVLTGQTEEYLPQLYEILRPACRVCVTDGKVDLTQTVKFLGAHPPQVKLLQCRAGVAELPTLYFQKGRGQIVQ